MMAFPNLSPATRKTCAAASRSPEHRLAERLDGTGSGWPFANAPLRCDTADGTWCARRRCECRRRLVAVDTALLRCSGIVSWRLAMVGAEALNCQPEIHVGPKAPQNRPASAVAPQPGAGGRPYRKREGARPPERRQQEQPAYDWGNWLTWLERILAGNNEKLNRDLVAMNRRFDRIQHKMNYWQQRAAFKLAGKCFRFDRWKAAEEEIPQGLGLAQGSSCATAAGVAAGVVARVGIDHCRSESWPRRGVGAGARGRPVGSCCQAINCPEPQWTNSERAGTITTKILTMGIARAQIMYVEVVYIFHFIRICSFVVFML